MPDNVQKVRDFVTAKAASEDFIHHKWFSRWHLTIVEEISVQLLAYYPQADEEMVRVMAWMHDYGKILDFKNQHDFTYIEQAASELRKLGFDREFEEAFINNMRGYDAKENLHQASIETQIVSSADACSHLVGPFLSLFWWENPQKPHEDIMQETIVKLSLEWDKKVVIPEARSAYQHLHDAAMDRSVGKIPPL